jgi:hypothetical protein
MERSSIACRSACWLLSAVLCLGVAFHTACMQLCCPDHTAVCCTMPPGVAEADRPATAGVSGEAANRALPAAPDSSAASFGPAVSPGSLRTSSILGSSVAAPPGASGLPPVLRI